MQPILDEGIGIIADGTFKNDENLVVVELPATLTTIGKEAFAECRQLKSIVISEGTKEISDFAFRSCESLEYVKLPSTLTNIGKFAFANCFRLKNIQLPDGLISIESYAFKSCWDLTEIYLPQSLTFLGEGAFYNCQDLESITIPSKVTTIYDQTFRNCISLRKLNLSSSHFESIGEYAIHNCQSLETLTLASKLYSVHLNNFVGCNSDLQIKICDKVEQYDKKNTKCTDLGYAASFTTEEKEKNAYENVGILKGNSRLEYAAPFAEEESRMISRSSIEDSLAPLTIQDWRRHYNAVHFDNESGEKEDSTGNYENMFARHNGSIILPPNIPTIEQRMEKCQQSWKYNDIILPTDDTVPEYRLASFNN